MLRSFRIIFYFVYIVADVLEDIVRDGTGREKKEISGVCVSRHD